MAKKTSGTKAIKAPASKPAKPSALLDTRVIYCGDNLEQLRKLFDRTYNARHDLLDTERMEICG